LASYAIAGDSFAAVMVDPTSPGELYVAELSDIDGTAEAVTNLNEGQRTTAGLKYETIEYTTSSGFDVAGVYVYPGDWSFPPAEPKPVVVWQQGDPGGQMSNSWATSVENPHSLLPSFGVPLFLVNGAGRESNGAEYFAAMYDGTNFGQRDIEDVIDGVEHLISMGVVDGAAVGVTGCSYGGYFTLQGISSHPDFFAAGNTQCTLNDLLYEYNFGWTPTIAALMGLSVTEDPDEYLKDSPFYNVGAIKTPLLIFHGTNDFLPYEHMTNVHDQLEGNGVATRFLRAHGYGHGFGSAAGDQGGRKAQRYAFQLQLTWFREHLGLDGPSPGPERSPTPIDLLPRLPIKGVMYQ
jgi:dipeptidyl aminopeptidase/acylaminoacyl peptidase